MLQKAVEIKSPLGGAETERVLASGEQALMSATGSLSLARTRRLTHEHGRNFIFDCRPIEVARELYNREVDGLPWTGRGGVPK